MYLRNVGFNNLKMASKVTLNGFFIYFIRRSFWVRIAPVFQEKYGQKIAIRL
jgi:hypothetical protein